MWIECIRIQLPRPRPADAELLARDNLRDASRRRRARSRPAAAKQADARQAGDESLVSSIYAGLRDRGLLAEIDAPNDRVRRRVGYVVRDALHAWRRDPRLPTRTD
mgnify:CR=1 FL=1